jgi:hypothetical protein
MQLSFGQGALWGERTDVIGSGIGPRQFGVVQEVTIDFDWTDKPLFGQFQLPVKVARSQGKITGKCKFAQILGLLYTDIFFGMTNTTGQFPVAQDEPNIVPSTTTVFVTNAATFVDDLGVTYANNTKRFNRVTTPSAAGQYSVDFVHGVYTFSSVDVGAAVLISYTYNIATSGTTTTLTNQYSGVTPIFKATFYSKFAGGNTALRLNACVAEKLSLPFQIANWTFQDLDFTALADSAGQIGYLSTTE